MVIDLTITQIQSLITQVRLNACVLGQIRRSFRCHGCRFKRAVTAVWPACGGWRDVRRRQSPYDGWRGGCLAAAVHQLPTALDFTVHRRQFSDGLLANFVGFSFNTQTCRSSVPHVAAAAAHLFPHWLINVQRLENRNRNRNRRFFLQNRTENDRKRKIQNRNNTIYNCTPTSQLEMSATLGL